MTTTERLLRAAADIWEGYHSHPFIRGIADGTLDSEKFRFYMVQDYLYLFDYARVFALGVVKAKDADVMRAFATYVHQILDGEMSIHRGYMERLGIDLHEAEHATCALANTSYTAYMLDIAFKEGEAEIAAAILSCALSYEVIARKIVADNPASIEHPFYGEWIASYASEDYHAANEALIALTERLTADYSEVQLQHLCEIFVICSRYEAMFWDMAWRMEL